MFACENRNAGVKSEELFRQECGRGGCLSLAAADRISGGEPENEMRGFFLGRRLALLTALSVTLPLFMVAFGAATAKAQEDKSDKAEKPDKHATTRLRIEVTGGDANKPVADASVYVRYPNDKKF